jgi:hypothetical protein
MQGPDQAAIRIHKKLIIYHPSSLHASLHCHDVLRQTLAMQLLFKILFLHFVNKLIASDETLNPTDQWMFLYES